MLTSPALHPHRSKPRRPAQGFLLIEVLVALLIFSIGTLGLVGLQTSLTRAASSAKMRADAAYLAQDLIGTMWADAPNLASYVNCSAYAPCATWLAKVNATLPSAGTSLSICTAGSTCAKDSMNYTPLGQVVITITWAVPGEASHTYQTSTSINPS